MKTSKVKTITGDLVVDDRGVVRFVNDFNFQGIKRFYQVENHNRGVIRAFHGHLKEGKYIYVVSGSVLICAVRITDKKEPDKSQKVERHVLSDKKPTVLFIPPGYANGFRCLEENTSIIFYSTSTLKETKKDDFRFPYDYWGTDIWEIKNR